MNTRKLITSPDGNDFPWETGLKTNKPPTHLYFGRFDPLFSKYILAGGSNGNEAKLFDITGKHYASFTGFDNEIMCGTFNRNNTMLALGGADGYARVYNVTLPQ